MNEKIYKFEIVKKCVNKHGKEYSGQFFYTGVINELAEDLLPGQIEIETTRGETIIFWESQLISQRPIETKRNDKETKSHKPR